MSESKSPKGGRTVRERAMIEDAAEADLERDGGCFLRGLERVKRSPSVVGIGLASPIPKMPGSRVAV